MKWATQIQKAEKFLENAREHGRKVYDRYADERDNVEGAIKKANFFYANVNTQKESLFNSLPKPEVARLHKGNYDDEVARVAALIMSRALAYEVNCAESFQESISNAIQDRLIPGIGQIWVRFDANPESPGSEKLFLDTVYWEDFLFSPARSWTKVTWVARIIHLSDAEMKEQFGKGWEKGGGGDSVDDDNTPKEITEGMNDVYEIWHKRSKKVIFTMKGRDKPLKEIDDPYGLTGFFPCPRPLMANVTTKKFLPLTDYYVAQDQYEQLDTLYARIQLIIEAVKVAGAYDASATEIGRMLSGVENKLIPVDNWAMYAEKGGAKGLIDWYPIEHITPVLQALQAQFEVSKQILYEITGMADIIRGASNQYETASAQKIKAQFAGVRLNGAQREIALFVRDVLRIMAGVMAKLYSEEKFIAVVGNLSPPDAEIAPQAMEILRNNMESQYKIDIESDSLTQADWALEKEQKMTVVQTIGQVLAGAIQMMEKSPEIAVLSTQLAKFSISGLKGSTEIEGWLDQQIDGMLQKQKEMANQPKPPSPEQQKMMAEQQQAQAEFQMEQQKAQMEMQMAQQQQQAEMAQSQAEFQLEQQKANLEMQHAQQMAQLDERIKTMDLMFTQQMNAMKLQFQAQQGQQKLELQERAAEIKEHERSEPSEE